MVYLMTYKYASADAAFLCVFAVPRRLVSLPSDHQALCPGRGLRHDLFDFRYSYCSGHLANHFIMDMGNDAVGSEVMDGMTEDVTRDGLRTVRDYTLLVAVPQRKAMPLSSIDNVIDWKCSWSMINPDKVPLTEGIEIEPLFAVGISSFNPSAFGIDAMIWR